VISCERRCIYLTSSIVSIALSAWYAYIHPIINKDAVVYLLAAYAKGDASSLGYASHWIFFSWLIHGVATVLGVTAETSAKLLGASLDLLLILAFLRLLERLRANSRTLAVGAIVVLVLPYLNDNRAEIIRDHGYWAFSMIALIFYVDLMRRFSWKDLLGWYIAMGTATLFRVEGAAFLALMPLGLLTIPATEGKRLLGMLKAYLPLAVGITVLLAGMDKHTWDETRLATELSNGWFTLQKVLMEELPAKAEALQQLLSPYYDHAAAVWVLFFAALVDIVKDLITTLSWPFFLILLFRRWFPAPGLPAEYRRALFFYLGVSALVLLFQELRFFIMIARHTQALALALLPVVVFALDDLWQRYRKGRVSKTLATAVLAGILALAADSLIESASDKSYLLEIGQWAAGHIPSRARILSDNETARLQYYMNDRAPGERQVRLYPKEADTLQGFDYAVVAKPGSELSRILSDRKIRSVARFPQRKGKTVEIYPLK